MTGIEVKQTARFVENTSFFVVFVKTGKEELVAGRLQELFCRNNNNSSVFFVPTKDFSFVKSGGQQTIRRTALIGGYVFLASANSPNDVISTVEPLIYGDSTVFKLLSNDGKWGEHKAFIQKDCDIMSAFFDILDDDFHISALPARKIDKNKFEIIDNHLEKRGGEFLKFNIKHKTAVMRLSMLNRNYDCEIALEFEDSIRESKRKQTLSKLECPMLRRESVVLRLGDVVEVVSGSASGCEGKIVGFDGKELVVAVDVFGAMRDVRVGVDGVRRSGKVVLRV